tara:strand:+ start:15 stop:353 length:339 start_codon:yes stop_codon:yes gene_type:complete
MKVYISGQITSLRHDQYLQAFKDAAKYLEEQGHEPVDPSELGKPEHRSWHYYMKKAIPLLCECDAIYMLNGWGKSKGAQIERTLARGLGMPIFEESQEIDMDYGNYGQQEIK